MKIQVKIMSMLMLFTVFAFTACENVVEYEIGDTGPAGGLIFYNWDFYLEAAPYDQSTGVVWGGHGIEIGATAMDIGTGETNTTTIVATFGAGTYAAKICDDLELDGYSDWFLPSLDELNLMYVNLKQYGVGDFTRGHYWSSSAGTGSESWVNFVNFSDGLFTSHPRGSTKRVRAVRAF